MRRLMLLLFLLLLPVSAQAVPEVPYAPDTMIGYALLTPAQQAIFDLAYAAARQGVEDVDLPKGSRYDDAVRAMHVLVYDTPELCAVDRGYSLRYYRDEPQEVTGIKLEYVMDAQKQDALIERARALVDGAYGDEYEREVYLHDLLCDLVVYDQTEARRHDAWGALMNGRAVCDGYAQAMSLLLRMSDVGCSMVTANVSGKVVGHAWNIVYVDGAYAWLDVTSDDQQDVRIYDYFNLTDEWMLGMRYILDDTLTWPACTDESINWHVRNWRMVESAEDMERHVFSNFQNLLEHGSRFSLRFRHEEDFDDFITRYKLWWERYEEAANVVFSGDMTLFYTQTQYCVTVLMYK